MTNKASTTPGAIKNFRQLGGLKNRTGQTFRADALFRSGHLADRSGADSETLAKLGINTVIDFRSDAEKARHTVFFDETWQPNYLPVPIGGNAAAWVHSLMEEMATTEFPAEALHNQFIKAFQAIPIHNADGLAQFFASLGAAEDGAILFHCTAGKDRTGIAAALLKKMLNFDDDVILANFMATNAAVDLPKASAEMAEIVSRKTGVAVSGADVLPMVGVKESFLDALFDTIQKDFGDFNRYRVEALKVSDEDLAMLERRFLV